jgi:putative ABC transport system permease protein
VLCLQTCRDAAYSLRANKTRACLTTLGVVMGSACLVLVVTIGFTGKHYVERLIEGVGSNLIFARRFAPGPTEPNFLTDEITTADLESVRELPNVRHAAGFYDRRMPIHVSGADRTVAVVGITEDYPLIRNLTLLAGRYFDGTDSQTHAKACLLSEGALNLIGEKDAIGKVIRIGDTDLTVVGVFREQTAALGQTELEANAVLVPLSVMQYFTGDQFLRGVYAQAETYADVPQVTRAVRHTLESRHRPGDQFNVENLTAILGAANSISNALSLSLLVVAAIALLLSGIGIMNIMLVTVTQRTHEIGVLKLVGATRTEIQLKFLTEALMISAGGAAIGVAIAVLLPMAAQVFFLNHLYIPISGASVAISFFVSSAIVIVFGSLPARRASLLTTTEALRYES